MARRIFQWAALFLALVASAAAEPARRATDARFVRLSAAQGLSQDSVFCILQDYQRFVWFGTEEGLNRYDGYSFKIFKNRPHDPTSLPSNWISTLYEDRAHRLWVGTLDGVSVFDRTTETFRSFRRPGMNAANFGESAVTSIAEDARGNLWVGTPAGLSRLDPVSGEFTTTLRHDDKDPASLSHDHVEALQVDREGRMWVAGKGGLDLFDPARGTFVAYHDAASATAGGDWIWGMAEDQKGRLWLGTFGRGLAVLDPATRTFRRYQVSRGQPQGLPNDWITRVLVDHTGAIFAGTDGSGLLRYDPSTDAFVAFKSRPRDTGSLSRNVVRSIYEDLQHNLWVGTFKGGVNLLQQNVQGFTYYEYDPDAPGGLSAEHVHCFLEDRAGRLWLGTVEGGLDLFDRATGTFTYYRHDEQNPRSLSRDIVTSLHQDRAGRIWVGTHGSGLDLFDPARGTFTHYQRNGDSPHSIVDNYIWSIAEDPDGALWIGTDNGLDRFDVAKNQFTHFRHEAGDDGGLADNSVRVLAVTPPGDLWVGSLLGGVDLLPHGQTRFTHFRSDPKDGRSLSSNTVVSLYPDGHGQLWIGTLGGGLGRLDLARREAGFTSLRTSEGLPSDSVDCIVDDEAGNLWISTNNGLARLGPDLHEVKTFGLSNGLRSLQFNPSGCRRTRDGRLLFGSAIGFYWFDPRTVKTDTYVPPVVFTGLRLFGQAVRIGDSVSVTPEIRLAYDQNVVSLEFAALDFTVPRGNAYSYMLEGFRPDWSDLGPKHEVTFTNLDPGAYTLRVRASNSDGVWNEAGAALRLVVTPPFWATWWFRALMAATLVGVLLTAHRLRIRTLEQRERELTRRVDESMARVKVLRGLLPMCAWCKKVRDDGGYWNQIEAYLAEHSEADFSHGICPDCALKIAPGRMEERHG
jgi:ligand-binding sensor domain-containing protein